MAQHNAALTQTRKDVKAAAKAAEQRRQARIAAERAEVARQARLAEERRTVARKQAAEQPAAAPAKAVTTRATPEPKPPAQQPQVKVASVEPAGQTFEATAYTAFCNTGCTGVTATGLNVANTIYAPSGRRIVAVDPAVIALGSIVVVTLANGQSFEAEAQDTGGAIKGNRIDILVATHADAVNFGRQAIKITRK